MSTAARTVPSPQRWRAGVFTVFFVNGVMLASWVSRIPAVEQLLGASPAEMGLLIFGLSIGSIAGLFGAAPLSGALGARRTILFSLLLGSAGLVLVGGGAVLASFGVLFAGLIVVGLSLGCCDVVMNVEGAAVERALGTTTLPMMHAGFSLGSVVGALGGAQAEALHWAITPHLLGVAVVAVLITVLAILQLPAHLPAEPVESMESIAGAETGEPDAPAAAKAPLSDRFRSALRVWADQRLLLIGVIMLGMTFAEGGANDWIGLAATDGHGMSKASGAIVLATFLTAMTIARMIGGRLVDAIGRVAAIRLSGAIAVVGLAAFILAPAEWLVYLAAALWGLGCALGFPLGMSAAADDPAKAGERVAAVAVIGYFAFLAGPPLLGLLAHSIGYLQVLWVILALVLLSMLASPAARESGDRTRASASEPR